MRVSEFHSSNYSRFGANISEFVAGSNGNSAPQRTIAGANTGFGRIIGPIALNEKSGNIGVIADFLAPPYIELFALESSGNVAPAVVLGNLAPLMNLPVSIAVDHSGKIYVANEELGGIGGGCPPIQGTIRAISQSVKTGTPNSITIYASGSSADAPPIATISGSNTGLAFPDGVAVDATKIYVGNADGGSANQGSVTEYPISSNGNVSPVTVITGPDTGLVDPSGVALDISGNIYVANAAGGSDFTGSVTVYAPASSGDAKPIAAISGSNTGLSRPQSIGVDSKGNIYVGNAGNNSITAYSASAKGNAVPSATIKGSKTLLTPDFSGWIAVDEKGDIFAATGGFDTAFDSVLMFPSGSNGNIAPAAILAGPHTQLSFPEGLAVVTSP